MANIVSTWWTDFKAWRRGDRRIAARGVRGRIYDRAHEEEIQPVPDTGVQQVKQKTTFEVTARVIHADGSPDTYYKL